MSTGSVVAALSLALTLGGAPPAESSGPPPTPQNPGTPSGISGPPPMAPPSGGSPYDVQPPPPPPEVVSAPPPPPPDQPKDGRGMLIAGGMLLGVGAGATAFSSYLLADTGAGCSSDTIGEGAACGLGIAGGVLLLMMSSAMLIAGSPLTILGASRRGRYDGWADARAGDWSTARPGLTAAGATLTGLGGLAALGGIPLAVELSCSRGDGYCRGVGYGVGYGISIAVASAGIAMLIYPGSRRRQLDRERAEYYSTFRVAPTQLRGGAGLAFSGRF